MLTKKTHTLQSFLILERFSVPDYSALHLHTVCANFFTVPFITMWLAQREIALEFSPFIFPIICGITVLW